MNRENIEFLKRNNIDIYELNQTVDCHIYSREEENPIVANYDFQNPSEKGNVSIARIIGYDTRFRRIPSNIIMSMDDFFDATGDGYHTRSIGMLQYTKEDILESLKKSMEREPISIIETGEGNYTILSNGLHRYTLLRILYLSEIANAKGNKEEIERINNKYTIPVEITGVDLEKTYCKYILMENQVMGDDWCDNGIRDIQTYYDEDFSNTGRIELIYNNGKKIIMDKEQLMQFTRKFIIENNDRLNIIQDVMKDYKKYKSLKKFINDNFSDIFKINEQNNTERRDEDDDRIN